MSIEEAKSVGTDSDKNIEDDEEYETITISEAPVDQERYDKDIDMLEEKEAIEKLKGLTYVFVIFLVHMSPAYRHFNNLAII